MSLPIKEHAISLPAAQPGAAMTPDASKKHNPDPAYLRALIARAGLSQRAAAKRIGMSLVGLQNYIKPVDDRGYRPAPYPVQYALEQLALDDRPKKRTKNVQKERPCTR